MFTMQQQVCRLYGQSQHFKGNLENVKTYWNVYKENSYDWGRYSVYFHFDLLYLAPGLSSGPPPSSMLSYQQQQHLLRRGTASMGQVSSFFFLAFTSPHIVFY